MGKWSMTVIIHSNMRTDAPPHWKWHRHTVNYSIRKRDYRENKNKVAPLLQQRTGKLRSLLSISVLCTLSLHWSLSKGKEEKKQRRCVICRMAPLRYKASPSTLGPTIRSGSEVYTRTCWTAHSRHQVSRPSSQALRSGPGSESKPIYV